MRKITVPAILLLLCLRTHAAPDEALREAIRETTREAEARELHFHPRWLALLHYQKIGESRYRSTIDSRSFFLSPQGSQSPLEELKAGLLAHGKGDSSFACRFPARFRFLRNRLVALREFDPEWPDSCPELEQWKSNFNLYGVDFVVAAPYLGRVSSVFGHTFLRLKSRREGHEPWPANPSVHYGSDMAAEFLPVHLWKGAFGGYLADYALSPYYTSLEMYSWKESRDLHFYSLAVSSRELRILVEHLFELRHAVRKYYFFTENCTYHLLTLLNAMQPEWELNSLPSPAMPSVAARRLLDNRGLVRQVSWLPSPDRRFELLTRTLEDKERKLLSSLMLSPATPSAQIGEGRLDTSASLKVLEAAILGLQVKKEHAKHDSVLERRQHELLAFRATRPETSNVELPLPAGPQDNPPHLAHALHRASFGLGLQHASTFMEVAVRYGYHDLNGSPDAYPLGVALEGLGMRLRYWLPPAEPAPAEAVKGWTLEEVELVKWMHLRPWTRLRKTFSWTVNSTLSRPGTHGCERCLTWDNALGVGEAWQLGAAPWALGYALIEARGYRELQHDENWGGGPRLRVGGRLSIQSALSLWTQGSWYHELAVEAPLQFQWLLQLRATPFGNRELRMEIGQVGRSRWMRLLFHFYFD